MVYEVKILDLKFKDNLKYLKSNKGKFYDRL